MHTAEPLVPQPRSFEVETATEIYTHTHTHTHTYHPVLIKFRQK